MTDRPQDQDRQDQVFGETAGECAEGPLAEEAFGASRRWGGYGSDQGEPGDAEDLGVGASAPPAPDATVRAEVTSGLEREADLDARDLAVDVVDGEVVLQGTVGSEETRRRVERIARGTPGARSVRNELEIRRGELEPPGDRGRAA